MAEQTTIQSTAVVTATTSKQFTLNLNDFWRGLVQAIGAPALVFLYEAINTGGFNDIDWQGLIKVSAGALIIYLGRNFFEKGKTVVEIVPPAGQLTTQDVVKIKDTVNIEQEKQQDKGGGK